MVDFFYDYCFQTLENRRVRTELLLFCFTFVQTNIKLV
jgi:hypothetical protein